MIKIITTITLIFTTCLAYSQEQSPFYIGHSLINHNMPNMVQALAVDAGKTTYYGKQIINGSSLKNNYENPNDGEGTPYTTGFPNGNYNTLIVTEAIPLQNHITFSDTNNYANNFYNYAKNNNNGTPVRFYIYETWHCINSGTTNGCNYDNTTNSNTLWHPRLLADFPLWSGIVTHVRNQNPNDTEIWMIPAGQAFYNLTTQINNNDVPGITNSTDLFEDDIHLTNLGNYFIACVMYATIYRESPVGLTTSIMDQYSNPYENMPTEAQALKMQEIAWSTVTNLNDLTGVDNSALSIEGIDTQIQEFSISPNPSHEYISINGTNENEIIEVYSANGALVKEILINANKKIRISDLPNGLYFMAIKNSKYKVQKLIKHP